jgi:hypothetical protein
MAGFVVGWDGDRYGWFATTTWYHQWYSSIVLPVFALAVAIIKLPPLPAE